MGCIVVCLTVNTTRAKATEDATQRDRVIALVTPRGANRA